MYLWASSGFCGLGGLLVGKQVLSTLKSLKRLSKDWTVQFVPISRSNILNDLAEILKWLQETLRLGFVIPKQGFK